MYSHVICHLLPQFESSLLGWNIHMCHLLFSARWCYQHIEKNMKLALCVELLFIILINWYFSENSKAIWWQMCTDHSIFYYGIEYIFFKHKSNSKNLKISYHSCKNQGVMSCLVINSHSWLVKSDKLILCKKSLRFLCNN